MTEDPAPTEAEALKERLRRRLVAARTLADLGQKELAAKIKTMGYRRGYSARTIGDMERGETPIQPQSFPVLAKACDLPAEFFTVDFKRLPELTSVVVDDESDQPSTEERLRDLETMLNELRTLLEPELEELAREATPLVAGGLPQPPGELGRRLREARRKREHPPQEQNPGAGDQPKGDQQ